MTCDYHYEINARMEPPVAFHFFKLRVVPMNNAAQRVVENCVTMTPDVDLRQAVDGMGNIVLWGSYATMHREWHIVSRGTVQLNPYSLPCPEPEPIYRHASRLTEWDSALKAWAWSIVADTPRELWPVAIMHAVAGHLKYERNVTGNMTTALAVFELRGGVCQDYAHLMISACRSLGLAARYAAGMVPGEGETHAWVEVWSGGAWWAYDPTLDCCSLTLGYIRLAVGRDAADCPLNRGRFFTHTLETLDVSCQVKIRNDE